MSLVTDRYWEFVKYREASPRPSYLEIEQDWRERLPHQVGASGRLFRETLRSAATVLDVGAGDRRAETVLKHLGVTARYQSADIAMAERPHDFGDFLQVTERFDAIMMQELVEHLPLDLGVEFMAHAHRILNPGGVLWITTPNPRHPNSVWRYEVTHIRPWPATDLYGALKLVGFREVRLYRQFLRALTWKRRAVTPLAKLLYAIMELDHAQSTIVVAIR
jgi:SAM-dependent methyltransferase